MYDSFSEIYATNFVIVSMACLTLKTEASAKYQIDFAQTEADALYY